MFKPVMLSLVVVVRSNKLSFKYCEQIARRYSVVLMDYNLKQHNDRCRTRPILHSYLDSTCALVNFVHTSRVKHKNKENETSVVRFDDFANSADKSKDTFLDLIHLYEGRHTQRRGHVEFIYVAMKHMVEFGVEKDLESYKKLIDVFPKGKFIPQNVFQVEFQHYPKQQQCAIDILDQMEDNGIIPDKEVEVILRNVFGMHGHPVRKLWRMMYWMPKFKNLSPWPVPKPPPNRQIELAMLAIQRITSVDLQSTVQVWDAKDVEDSIDKAWIVSGQSPKQQELLLKHKDTGRPVIVEGGSRVWLRNKSINYCVLKADPLPEHIEFKPIDTDDVSNIEVPYFKNKIVNEKSVERTRTVHEQDDGTIYAVCATSTSSKDSLLSWIRLLQRYDNPVLGDIPVLFRLRSIKGDIVPFSEALINQENQT